MSEVFLYLEHGAVAVGGGEQLLSRNVQRFRGGLVYEAHRLLYHSTLDSRVVKKKKTRRLQHAPFSGQDVLV